MKITADVLNKLEACADQVKLFDQVFPNGTTVTLCSLTRARKHELNVYWFVKSVLSDAALNTYNKRTLAPYRAYQKNNAAAFDVYDKALGIVVANGVNPRKIAWVKCNKIQDAAFVAYNHARDTVFVALLKNPANLKPELRDLEE